MNITRVDSNTLIIYEEKGEYVVVYLVKSGYVVDRRVVMRPGLPHAPLAIEILQYSQVFGALLKAVLMTWLILALLSGQHDLVQIILHLLSFGN